MHRVHLVNWYNFSIALLGNPHLCGFKISRSSFVWVAPISYLSPNQPLSRIGALPFTGKLAFTEGGGDRVR